MKKIAFTFLIGIFGLNISNSFAGVAEDLQPIQEHWAMVNYQLEGDAQIGGFDELQTEINALIQAYPDAAEPYIWQGIILSTRAGAEGGLGALGLAKDAKRSLEHALEVNPNALSGSAYASLGTLYYKVPGWPIGFGSKRKAREHLEAAIELAPESIDNNYFYADFLFEIGDYDLARVYAVKALDVPPREHRPIADAGRRTEIEGLMARIDARR